jgi:aspartyl-tRNA(Asn)/glutamyl-tRNA(Gln) amidotransferase subunit C
MLTKADVEKVAHLARLQFEEDELEAQFTQLESIMAMMDSLSEINTDGVEPLAHVMDIHNVFHEDEVHESIANEKALANAPSEVDHMFQVPKIV